MCRLGVTLVIGSLSVESWMHREHIDQNFPKGFIEISRNPVLLVVVLVHKKFRIEFLNIRSRNKKKHPGSERLLN